MYSVSDEYKVAVADSHRKSSIRAILTTKNSKENITDSEIIKDSVYITNQCTNGNEYEYGCVYAGECGLTIKSNNNIYDLYDAKLELYWRLLVGSVWEEVPLGVFYITEPNRINDKISIKALDGMSKLDVNVEEDTQGTMPQLVAWIAEKCGVEMAQTQEELSAFVNGNVQYSVYADTVETYRDLLAYVCMMSASFATFNRDGRLQIVQYAEDPCVDIGKKQRFMNATFSDYTTKYVGIKARFIAEENYAPYEAGETGDGLILDMGDNPIVRGLPETKHALLNNVFDVLKNVSYTPFEIETLGNPALDLGDMIVNSGVGKEGKRYFSPITYYYWTYRGKHKLRGVGGNPRLSGVKNKQGKQIDSLENEIATKNVVVKNYTNADVITFTGAEKEIATLNYAATENSNILFLMTVRLSVSLDGLLVIKFYTDAKEDKERIYKQYVERGEHIVTISDIYVANTNDRHTISIKAHMEYVESDSRKQDANIKTCNNFLDAIKNTGATVSDNAVAFPAYNSGVIDTTIATATVDKGGVKAILYGQGLAGEGKWDGTINFSEIIESPFALSSILHITDNASYVFTAEQQIPAPIIFTDVLQGATFGSGLIFDSNVSDNVVFNEVVQYYLFNVANSASYEYSDYVSTESGAFALKTEYKYSSVEEAIDVGKMCSVAIDYTGLNVESVVVTNG